VGRFICEGLSRSLRESAEFGVEAVEDRVGINFCS
jgi:hypothetical protein